MGVARGRALPEAFPLFFICLFTRWCVHMDVYDVRLQNFNGKTHAT